MPCTTILVGKKASYDGSTMIARNDDAGGNQKTDNDSYDKSFHNNHLKNPE